MITNLPPAFLASACRHGLLLLSCAIAALTLPGCGREGAAQPGTPATPVVAAAPGMSLATLDTVAKEATGFSVGSAMSARVVYVFFDTQCPHCAALWQAAKPLKAQARFVWIPVALLNDKSAPQGATILAAADPAAAMDLHEESVRNKQGGIGAGPNLESRRKAVEANTALLNRLGIAGVPGVLTKNAVTGEFVSFEGALPTPALAQRIGLAP